MRKYITKKNQSSTQTV